MLSPPGLRAQRRLLRLGQRLDGKCSTSRNISELSQLSCVEFRTWRLWEICFQSQSQLRCQFLQRMELNQFDWVSTRTVSNYSDRLHVDFSVKSQLVLKWIDIALPSVLWSCLLMSRVFQLSCKVKSKGKMTGRSRATQLGILASADLEMLESQIITEFAWGGEAMAIHKDKFQDYMRLCFCEELSFLCSRAVNCWCLRQKSCLSHFAPSWTSNLQTRWAQNWELWAATWFTEGVNINFECNYFQYIHAVFYDIYVTQEIILESWFLIFAFWVCPAWWANNPSFMLRMSSNSWGLHASM